MSIHSIKPHDIPMIANLMVGRNKLAKDHCAYVWDDVDQMREYLDEIYEEGGSIILYEDGVAAADILDDNRTVEVLGPYGDSELACVELIQELQLRHPAYELLFFVHEQNVFVRNAVKQLGGVETGIHLSMVRTPELIMEDPDIRPLRRGEYIRSLHDELFPDTYYSGATLEEMHFSEEAKLAVLKIDKDIKGYVFYQTTPGLYVDYIGVKPQEENKGYGTRLLAYACRDMFCTYEGKINITVSKDQPKAIRLYEKNHFVIEEENYTLRLK